MKIPKQEYTVEFKELAVKRVKAAQEQGAEADRFVQLDGGEMRKSSGRIWRARRDETGNWREVLLVQ